MKVVVLVSLRHSLATPSRDPRGKRLQDFADIVLDTGAPPGDAMVKIDGLGTANRSKAFHNVCWKNLGDAGFPDRIPWIQAAAAKYPYMDLSRVGIYGGSAGGQNAMGALLFHPEFYDAAWAFAGSHDNRMDKIWWNEQYMGWPIGPEYSKASTRGTWEEAFG